MRKHFNQTAIHPLIKLCYSAGVEAMRLESFSVENYRSITQARRISLGDSTVLIGPNNEGKSNILRALNAAMLATRSVRITGEENSSAASRFFNWKRDFPISLQKSKGAKLTKINLEFSLTEEEIVEFKESIKSGLNGSLPVCVTFWDSGFEVKIIKQGRGGASLNAKSDKIASFLAERIQFQYIPAIRTAQNSISIVESIVSSELRETENDPAFKDALESIRNLQRPILDEFSKKITETLKSFIPGIRSVNFSVDDERRFQALRQSIDITVDDGVMTSLSAKGDGIQSLVALGLRRHALEDSRLKKSYIFAIEEPEAHLHPDAVHELKLVLDDLSKVDQVILTTHSGSLANRSDISANVIVSKSTAAPARSLSEIRKTLGVRSQDNLINADLILLVEGDDDRLALREIIKHRSPSLKSAISTGRLAIESLDGASALAAKAAIFKSMLCSVHCFIDNDAEGRFAVDRAKRGGLIDESDYNLTICGAGDAEFEDLVKPEIYHEVVKVRFGVDLAVHKSRNKKSKWSSRMSESFRLAGKPFDDLIKQRLKLLVAEAVAAEPESAISAHSEGIIFSLTESVRGKLKITDN